MRRTHKPENTARLKRHKRIKMENNKVKKKTKLDKLFDTALSPTFGTLVIDDSGRETPLENVIRQGIKGNGLNGRRVKYKKENKTNSFILGFW